MNKIVEHFASFLWALVFSYFFFPSNLASPMSILYLLIVNFFVVEAISYLKNSWFKDK